MNIPKVKYWNWSCYLLWLGKMCNKKWVYLKLSTGNDPVIYYDLVKCVTKNEYTWTIMESWTEGFHQKSKIYQQDVF